MFAKAFAQVTRRQSAPGYVRHITGNVIKRAGVDIRLMSESEKRDARANAGSQNADAFVTSILQPSHGRARIEHCLAHRLDRTTNICTDQMVGARELWWPAFFVIGKSQTQC